MINSLKMSDSDLRGIILRCFYENRRKGKFTPTPENFEIQISNEEIDRICGQLDEKGLIIWEGNYSFPDINFINMMSFEPKLIRKYGKITAKGIDVIEGNAIPEIAITLNIQLSLSLCIKNIVSLVEQTEASPEDKMNAKSKLKAFIEHPLITSILGSLSGEII